MGRLGEVNLDETLSRKEASDRLAHAQRRLTALRLQAGGQIGARRLGPPLAVLFEGEDAAGKVGAIRRLTARLDPRHFTAALEGRLRGPARSRSRARPTCRRAPF
jgi:polyphosphate kinase 2 (PPK2 family)